MISDRIRRGLISRIIRLIQLPRITFYWIFSPARVEGKARIVQPVQFMGKGVIHLGEQVIIGYFPSPMFFSGYGYIEARMSSASVTIGSNTWINNNFVAIAEHGRIQIGCRVLVGTCVEIYDSDFHGLKVEDRNRSDPLNAADVIIGDDVFIGSNVKILKGVHIGDGSVVANGAIVVKDIPPRVIAGGNPAKVIRAIE